MEPLYRLVATLLAVLPCLGAAPAHAQAASCPPQPQAPTAQQVQKAQSQARDRGLLWRVTKDGRTHHLYGTIHVGRLEWLFPGPQLAGALGQAQAVALELDPLDPAIQAAMQRSGAASPGATLPPALAQALARALERSCLPPAAMAGMHPLMQAMTATIVDAARDGLHAAFGQEVALSTAARARSVPVISLETPERQMAAVIPSDPAQAERFLASMLEQIDSGTARGVLRQLADAWERGDLAKVASYERWCDCVRTDDDRALLATLNDGRNPEMAERIEALHRQGQRLFVAVGALHMTGPKALPALLAARGFKVEAVPFR